MAASVVQSKGGSNVTVLAYTNPVVATNVLLVGWGAGGAGATRTVSDSVNGAWTAVPGTLNNAGSFSTGWLYFDQTAAGTPSLTLSAGSDCVIYEVSGLKKPVTFEGAATATGSSTAPAVNVTTVSDGGIVFGSCEGFGFTPIGGAGFTGTSPTANECDEWKIQAAHGTLSVAFTQSTGAWSVSGFGLTPAAGIPDLIMAPPHR